MAELKRLRHSYPNLGKEKVFAKLMPFCQTHSLSLPSVSTIGRMIGSTPDKLRTNAWQTNSKGQRKRFTRAPVTRKPKGIQLKALECLAFDTIKRHILHRSQNLHRLRLRAAHRKQCPHGQTA